MGIQERNDKSKQEYERIRDIFQDANEKLLDLLDGVIWEAARCRTELDELQEIAAESGLILVDKKNPRRQKELPVSRQMTRVRASYLNHMTRLAKALGMDAPDEEELGLEEYE